MRILSKFVISLSKMCTSSPKKTNQIYTNLKNWLHLCQKSWNQSTYWKLSPMLLHLLYFKTFLLLQHWSILVNIKFCTCLMWPSTGKLNWITLEKWSIHTDLINMKCDVKRIKIKVTQYKLMFILTLPPSFALLTNERVFHSV